MAVRMRGTGELLVDALVNSEKLERNMMGEIGMMPGNGRDLVPYFNPGSTGMGLEEDVNTKLTTPAKKKGKRKGKKGAEAVKAPLQEMSVSSQRQPNSDRARKGKQQLETERAIAVANGYAGGPPAPHLPPGGAPPSPLMVYPPQVPQSPQNHHHHRAQQQMYQQQQLMYQQHLQYQQQQQQHLQYQQQQQQQFHQRQHPKQKRPPPQQAQTHVQAQPRMTVRGPGSSAPSSKEKGKERWAAPAFSNSPKPDALPLPPAFLLKQGEGDNKKKQEKGNDIMRLLNGDCKGQSTAPLPPPPAPAPDMASHTLKSMLNIA